MIIKDSKSNEKINANIDKSGFRSIAGTSMNNRREGEFVIVCGDEMDQIKNVALSPGSPRTSLSRDSPLISELVHVLILSLGAENLRLDEMLVMKDSFVTTVSRTSLLEATR